MSGDTQLLSARSVHWIDIGVIVWVIVWVALGVLIWHDIRAQTQLSGDVIKVGTAVKDTGQALSAVGGLPLVGGSIGDFAATIEKLGSEVEASGQASQAGIERIAVIAGLGVGILPAAMILFLYLPVRVRWRRYVGAVADALPGSGGDPVFEQYLARRAADVLPWDRLRALSDDPWRAIASGDYRALADAELARLGLRRP
ncbi:MAG: hypothetical protein NTX16_00835 [Actinobacteria bacterium]|nr:hypothetical protein [Actinomycetota bacterium]